MFRLLGAPVRSAARAATPALRLPRACPPHVCRVAPALPTTIQQTQARAFTRSATLRSQDEEEDGEKRPVLPLSEARANALKALTEDVSELELTNEWTDGYVADAGFQVKVNLDNEGVLAERTHEGYRIRVTFRADEYSDGEEPASAEGEDQEPAKEQVFFIDITAPNGKIMRVDANNSGDGELVIGGLSFPSSVSEDPTQGARGKWMEDLPATEGAMEFSDLGPDAQEAVLDLFESLGVDDDLALFVSNQAQMVRTRKLEKDINAFKQFLQ